MTLKQNKMDTTKRFSITINDDDGKISLEIIDYLIKESAEISAEELADIKPKQFSIAKMCELIVKTLKPKFREIVKELEANS